MLGGDLEGVTVGASPNGGLVDSGCQEICGSLTSGCLGSLVDIANGSSNCLYLLLTDLFTWSIEVGKDRIAERKDLIIEVFGSPFGHQVLFQLPRRR